MKNDDSTKVTIGMKVIPEYVEEIDTMVNFFQSRIDVGKVTRSEVLIKALDEFKEKISASSEYQVYIKSES